MNAPRETMTPEDVEKLMRRLTNAVRETDNEQLILAFHTEPEPEFGCQHDPMNANCTLKHTGFQEGKTTCVWCKGVFYLPVSTAYAIAKEQPR